MIQAFYGKLGKERADPWGSRYSRRHQDPRDSIEHQGPRDPRDLQLYKVQEVQVMDA